MVLILINLSCFQAMNTRREKTKKNHAIQLDYSRILSQKKKTIHA
jgi:hypothetical protein